jgi:hypothetical protein
MRVCEDSVSTFVLIVDHAGLLIPFNQVVNVSISLLINAIRTLQVYRRSCRILIKTHNHSS